MNNISYSSGHLPISKGIYDRQLDTDLFKRLHATKFTLSPIRERKILGPGYYNPLTIEEIYRQKSCSKYGRYYQQSERFLSMYSKRKRSCNNQGMIHSLSNITDELRRKHEFERRFNTIRLDRQSSNNQCHQRKALKPRAPPVTLYEKSSFVDELHRKQTGIYGPYVQLAENHNREFPNWYKGPGYFQEKSILETFFTRSNRYKGKFLPLPSHRNANVTQLHSSPGPTTYFKELLSQSTKEKKNSFAGFLSSTERFHSTKSSFSHLGPASYHPNTCSHSCSKKKQTHKSKSIIYTEI
ncbi:hypothetical protein I4U23_018848 [Adineta vaga]|nr:hypothetical protein I4U23_018848 [Adineta vaga]